MTDQMTTKQAEQKILEYEDQIAELESRIEIAKVWDGEEAESVRKLEDAISKLEDKLFKLWEREDVFKN